MIDWDSRLCTLLRSGTGSGYSNTFPATHLGQIAKRKQEHETKCVRYCITHEKFTEMIANDNDQSVNQSINLFVQKSIHTGPDTKGGRNIR